MFESPIFGGNFKEFMPCLKRKNDKHGNENKTNENGEKE